MRQVWFFLAQGLQDANRWGIHWELIVSLFIIILCGFLVWMMIRASHRRAEMECKALLEKVRAHLLVAPKLGMPPMQAADASLRYMQLAARAEQKPEWEILLLDVQRLATVVEKLQSHGETGPKPCTEEAV